jgi:hypothetical protein
MCVNKLASVFSGCFEGNKNRLLLSHGAMQICSYDESDHSSSCVTFYIITVQ